MCIRDRLKNLFFVLQFCLETLSDLLKLFDIFLHVRQEHLLLMLLLFFIVCMAALLLSDILLELIKERREFPLEVIIDLAELPDLVTQLILLCHDIISV